MLCGSTLETSDSNSSMRSFDGFQRRKIGSLRDNGKLFKILQQFENGCRENKHDSELSQSLKRFTLSESAPCSLNNSKVDARKIFSFESKCKLEATSPSRRHSEGEVKNKVTETHSLFEPIFESIQSNPNRQEHNSTKSLKDTAHSVDALHRVGNDPSNSLLTNAHKTRGSQQDGYKLNIVCKKQTVSSSHNGHNNYSHTEKQASNSICSENEPPPPIPRRGLSLPVESLLQHNSSLASKKRLSPTSPINNKPPTSPLNNKPSTSPTIIKQDSVKKAIQMYEGLSSKIGKSHKARRSGNYPNIILKKDVLSSDHRKVALTRKTSKRNSFRKTKDMPSPESKKQGTSWLKQTHNNPSIFKHSKDDSGVGFSDTEDLKSPQAIYQTLCNMTMPVEHCDTYDRLNRIHDMVNRIHKGQSSTCAACKTIPPGSLQLSRTSGLALVHVKCNEMSPHHHPPCICFACQHSVFSCSQRSVPSTLDISIDDFHLTGQEENLYYNMCCLNGPNCEGWRRSRRRPVCEQNGRLCIVNCDTEKPSEEFYEKIFEWNTKQPSNVHSQTKHLSGDSCDSDEGWVDITDSEDEKAISAAESLLVNEGCSFHHSESSVHSELTREHNSVQTASYKAENADLPSMLTCDMSRAASSEHLYETIADIEAQNSSADDLREKTADNEPDSGEWSTESSSSPTPGEMSSLPLMKKGSASSNTSASKFTVFSDLENHDSSKGKTFIKSVLGKKSAPQKKKKTSHFFVPWLVTNQEYGLPHSPKSPLSKKSAKALKVDNGSTKSRTFAKSQRSQSIPSCSSSCLSTRKIFSSSEILDRCKSDTKELEQMNGMSDGNFGLSAETVAALSERGSLASSTYIRADQLHCIPSSSHREKSSTPDDSSVTDVSMEKVLKHSSSGRSMHSYIVFRPIKEEEVPLYQFYERSMKERVTLCRSPESLSPIMWSTSFDIGSSSQEYKSVQIKPQLSVVEQLSPDTKDIKMLWCELPEVKESGILERISAQELKLQEAAFEFIQSQASYIRSLKVLYEHFIQMPEFSNIHSPICVLSKHEHDVLFSDIIVVKEVSERLLADLTARWSDSILIPDICDIIYHHVSMPNFSIYVNYCSNRVYQEMTLKELEATRLIFLEFLKKFESNPACQGLSLESFLYLPLQHIARLPLLLDNIFKWLSPDSPSFNVCKMALESVHKTFMECNERARKMESLKEMVILNNQLEFKECKAIALVSASRWLLKRGELMKLEFDKKTFGRTSRCLRVPLYIFLFNDLLVITKRKSEDSYTVLDYCQKDKVKASAVDAKDLQQPDLVPRNCQYLMYLTLCSNHQGSSVDWIFNCTLQSERVRWIEAFHPDPPKQTTEVWEYDSPQVQCVRDYIAQQPDELSLQESDVVTVYRKMNDGWYEGKRLRDGLQGWFPASYTMDIPGSRARASNLRQCYRLLMLGQKHETKT